MALFVVLLSAVGAIVLYHAVGRYRNLQRNLAEAKKSGLPFVTTPWNVYSMFWLATDHIWLPVLKKLPASCRGLWLDMLDSEWAYRIGYRPFAQIGADVFLVVSPSKINAFVADAGVVTQITTRRADFPKPLQMYRGLDIYGKNVVSTEGSTWRAHRKLIAPNFGEKNNEMVFIESLHHAQALLRLWSPEQKRNKTVRSLAEDSMRFALYIISKAGFGVRVVWPHEETQNPSGKTLEAGPLLAGSQPPPGHKMNYRQAVSSLLENIMWTQIVPPKYLTRSPFQIHRETGLAVNEWGKYMDEMYEAKRTELACGQDNNPGMDLFQAMIRGSGISDAHRKSTDLQKSDILGNAFVLMVAGHETTANSIHFALIYLAMHWPSQKRLQDDLDETLKGKPISTWTYEDDFPKLFDGMGAAVMNETLRLLQPIINIPKSTAPGRPQPIFLNGKEHLIPADVHVSLCAAIHRNPKYWPAPANDSNTDGRPDVDRFRPERWLVGSNKLTDEFPCHSNSNSNSNSPTDPDAAEHDALGGPTADATSAHLFKPVKGSYIPFSDGYRSCIGRRFAQVEILACFAVIFSQYSVELAVDDFASDAQIEALPVGGRERRAIWMKAAARADCLLRERMASVVTLQLREGCVPVRIVRRGEERFAFE